MDLKNAVLPSKRTLNISVLFCPAFSEHKKEITEENNWSI